MTWYDYDNAPDPADLVDQNGPNLEPCRRCNGLGYTYTLIGGRKTCPTCCEHEHTKPMTDNWNNDYAVCEDCDTEVEPEDTRSFYRDESTGRVVW